MSEAKNGNGNGGEAMPDPPRPRPMPRPLPGMKPLTLTEGEALRHYGTMAARYDDFVARELPELKHEIDVTRGAALAAAGHSEAAFLESKRNGLVAAEALAHSKAAESAARRAEAASARTEIVVSNLAKALLEKARAVAVQTAHETAKETAKQVAEESGAHAAEEVLMRSQAITQDDLEEEARRAAEIVVQGHKLEETKEERDDLKRQAEKRSDRIWQFVIGLGLLASGGVGGALLHYLATK